MRQKLFGERFKKERKKKKTKTHTHTKIETDPSGLLEEFVSDPRGYPRVLWNR